MIFSWAVIDFPHWELKWLLPLDPWRPPHQLATVVKLRTFFVEDNPTIRDNLIATMAELADVEAVGVAETEADAVRWLSHNPDAWDLVIVDLFLREGSGLGIVTSLQHRPPQKKLLVLSNYATADMRQR